MSFFYRKLYMSSCGKNIVNQERVPIYGVIFDMDGTLTVPVLNFKMLREKLGIAGRKVDILQHIEDAPNATEKENRKKMVEDFEDEGDRLLQFQPNLHQLFYFLKKNNVKRALLTRNKQSAVDSFISKFIQEDDKGIFTDKNEIFSEVGFKKKKYERISLLKFKKIFNHKILLGAQD